MSEEVDVTSMKVKALWGGTVVALFAIGIYELTKGDWTNALILSTVGVLFGWAFRVARLKQIKRDTVLAAMASNPAISTQTGNEGITTRVASAVPPPELEVQIILGKELPEENRPLQKVTREANVVGDKPLKILHLWTFDGDAESRLGAYFSSSWRELGSIHFLRSAEGASAEEYAAAMEKGSIRSLIAKTEAEVDTVFAGFDYEPDVREKGFFAMGSFDGLRDSMPGGMGRNGAYPVNSLMCNDAVWKYAFHRMLEQVDLVTMDLSTFGEGDVGAAYELGQLLDQYPLDRVAFLIQTEHEVALPGGIKLKGSREERVEVDVEELQHALLAVWNTVSKSSPNRTAPAAYLFKTRVFDQKEPRRIVAFFRDLAQKSRPVS